jgi:Ca2+-binding RTX toxin-like protein
MSPLRSRRPFLEQLERREVFAPLPVLMVIADQRDFFYQEYGDTRLSLVEAGLTVRVAARTTNPSTPHWNSGQGASSGVVTPDLPLSAVNSADYSAIVFVGGWGSSMYQYAFTGDYYDNHYDGNAATKSVVNNLINQFSTQNKYIAAVCHATTVLAWARVNGVSPLAGKTVSVPYGGSPGVFWNGTSYSAAQLQQHVQMTANGATPLPHGWVGNRATDTDDVTVDGRIITAENNFSARHFGRVIAERLIAEDVPVNVAPELMPEPFLVDENSAAGTAVGQVVATDANVGQTLSYSIVGGNMSGAFAINAATGQLTVANSAALDYETFPVFHLLIQATDNATPALSDYEQFTITLSDVMESMPGPVGQVGPNVVVQGTDDADWIIISTNGVGQVLIGLNGGSLQAFTLGAGGRVIVYGGDGADRVNAGNSAAPVTVYGEAGNDLINGGSSNDVLDGGAGFDRIMGGFGHDQIFGGAENDIVDGREGNDLIVGGDGDDRLFGFTGNDVLIGGSGRDTIDGGAGEDLLIGGTTTYDVNLLALQAILAEWTAASSIATRRANLQTGLPGGVRVALGDTVGDDGVHDCLHGGADNDWLLVLNLDYVYLAGSGDLVS